MCQGHKVEDLIKFCARRAKQAGLLFMHIPTGRRPRPFAPAVLVPLRKALHPQAVRALRYELNFHRESTANGSERWMHELGVAFVRLCKHRRGFLWSANRLLPSQGARGHSEMLLGRFRDICELLDHDSPADRTPG